VLQCYFQYMLLGTLPLATTPECGVVEGAISRDITDNLPRGKVSSPATKHPLHTHDPLPNPTIAAPALN
jgi:hypothetical protein